MAKRPYVGKTVFELEAIFDRSSEDVKEVKLLSTEVVREICTTRISGISA